VLDALNHDKSRTASFNEGSVKFSALWVSVIWFNDEVSSDICCVEADFRELLKNAWNIFCLTLKDVRWH
jgi:hypothetical protein